MYPVHGVREELPEGSTLACHNTGGVYATINPGMAIQYIGKK